MSELDKYLIVRCPNCGEQIKQPIAWSGQDFTVACTCGFAYVCNDKFIQECCRSIQEVSSEIAKIAGIETQPMTPAEFAEYFDSRPEALAKLIKRLGNFGIKADGD